MLIFGQEIILFIQTYSANLLISPPNSAIMRISSSSLTLLALSLSTANAALPLPTRQLSRALESIQQSNKKSLTLKKSMIRALQAQEAEVDPETMACLTAYMMGMGGEADNDVGGDGGEGEDENDDNPLSVLDDVDYANTDVCDYATAGVGICDLSDTDIECDESDGSTMKIITNDMLLCKESVPEGEGAGMDLIYNNIPYCVPKVCPDDSNMVDMMIMFIEMFVAAFEQGLAEGGETAPVADGDGVAVDPTAELKEFTKEQCDSGTKLLTSTTTEESEESDSHDHDSHDSHDHSGDHTSDDGNSSGAAVKNMILSFSVAAAVGIGSFLVV